MSLLVWAVQEQVVILVVDQVVDQVVSAPHLVRLATLQMAIRQWFFTHPHLHIRRVLFASCHPQGWLTW